MGVTITGFCVFLLMGIPIIAFQVLLRIYDIGMLLFGSILAAVGLFVMSNGIRALLQNIEPSKSE